jgi:hypothetical protein
MFGATKAAMGLDDLFRNQPRQTVGVIQPHRENALGVIYLKDGKVFVAYFDGDKITDKEIDVELTTLQDLKKLLTIKSLKEKQHGN